MDNWKDVIDGMYGVVNEGGGTGVRAQLPHIEVCGKTGSAQLASNDFLKGTAAGHSENMKDNAWFVGFAPRPAPEIVVVALFEHGEHGQLAAPIVRDVLKAYFDKKDRLAALHQQEVAAGFPRPVAAGAWPLLSDMSRYLSSRDIDWTVLIIALFLCAVGALQIYSATRDTGFQSAWWKQIIYVFGGLLLMWIAAAVDYHSLLHYVPMMYAVSVLALVVTYVIGERTYGSRRWIPLGGGIHLEVSEFVKLVIILLVARYLADLKVDVLEIREVLKLAGLVAIPTVLVLKQPDLGTSVSYLAVLIAGAFLAGLRWKYIAAIAVVAVIVVPVRWQHFLTDYQKARLVSFMDPERDPQGKGYQLIQSQIAVGSGGMFGKGVTKGTQTQLRFLPVPHKDFIFSAFAEEHGFVGVVVVLALYFVMIMRIVQNAQTAPERAGMYICMGVASLLLYHPDQCGDGGRVDAGDRHPAALHERRWFQYLDEFLGSGAGK